MPPLTLAFRPLIRTFSEQNLIKPRYFRISSGRSHTHKVSAYADDLLFSLTNPHISNFLEEFDHYGALSNLKINYTKSEAMGVALPSSFLRHTLQLNFNFNWASSALKYLGTHIPPKLS